MAEVDIIIGRLIMRLLGVRLLWIGLALLAAFVLFVEYVADVGGDEAPIPQPTAAPTPTPATFEVMGDRQWAIGEWEGGFTTV